MKHIILENALNAIGKIYEDSKYDESVDLFRIHDIVNAVNSNQFDSKQWLADEFVLIDMYDDEYQRKRDILVMGGWYGLGAGLLVSRTCKRHIISVDFDAECERYGKILFPDVLFKTDDAINYFLERRDYYRWVINTSCEHMLQEDLDMVLDAKNEDTLICFQSNNYFEVDSHINCKNSLKEFEDSLNLKEILYSGELNKGTYTRYMVIGK